MENFSVDSFLKIWLEAKKYDDKFLSKMELWYIPRNDGKLTIAFRKSVK
jgi:hypothetical protein